MLPTTNQQAACDSYRRWIDPKQNRRDWLKKGSLTALAAGSLWTTLAESLAAANSKNNTKPSGRPKSMIVLWMQGGPSQLETFDPHPNSPIGGSTVAVDTCLPVPVHVALSQPVDEARCTWSCSQPHRATGTPPM